MLFPILLYFFSSSAVRLEETLLFEDEMVDDENVVPLLDFLNYNWLVRLNLSSVGEERGEIIEEGKEKLLDGGLVIETN